MASQSPLLLIIDEFGKNLEAVAGVGGGDPYLLQQLAEAGQGSGLPIFLLTLQHRSFEDYLSDAASPKRREWAKVQGRFEEVTYVESSAQTRAFIASAFQPRSAEIQKRISDWASPLAKEMRPLGLTNLKNVAACYPLHPLAALVLPELCRRYGQHERSLFSFLAGAEPSGAASFLSQTPLPQRGQLPSIGPDAVYDYFVAAAAGQNGRWAEVAARLSDAHGLPSMQERLAKSIAVLNLVAATGTLRSSRPVLRTLGPGADEALDRLEETGMITYREFADEYRVWEGSDIDIRRRLESTRLAAGSLPLAAVLEKTEPPQPRVAARHSAVNHLLRVFAFRYLEGGETVHPLNAASPYDGEVLLVVGAGGEHPVLADADCEGIRKPVVLAVASDCTALDATAREVAALHALADDLDVGADRVARREVAEMLSEAQTTLAGAATAAFEGDGCDWLMLEADGALRQLCSKSAGAALSEAADLSYPDTPVIRNEILNRNNLSTQGAKARRLLIEAMVSNGSEPNLGLTGYGPEVAMYRSFLAKGGLHQRAQQGSGCEFRPPSDESLKPAWGVMEDHFEGAKAARLPLERIVAALRSPPIGMKAGAIPVFLIAGLLHRSEDVALYELGTFVPELSAEVAERLVRNPDHFAVKHFAGTTGGRKQVLGALGVRLGISPPPRRRRVQSVLAVVLEVLARIRRLPNHTLRTRLLGSDALAVRDALVAAREPDELLFTALPEALGLRPVLPNRGSYSTADTYAKKLEEALDELADHFDKLLSGLCGLIVETCGETSRQAVTGLSAAIRDEVLDPDVRAFVQAMAADDADDAGWIKRIATVVARKAPAEWSDDDLWRFRSEIPQRTAALRRLVAHHADILANGGGPLDALRVVFTRPDGSEFVGLVGITEHQRSICSAVLDDALKQLCNGKGNGSHAQAHQALLALLGERMINGTRTSRVDEPPERRSFASPSSDQESRSNGQEGRSLAVTDAGHG